MTLITQTLLHIDVGVPTTDRRRLQDVKVEVMVWFMIRYDIMHEHDNQRDAWPSLVEVQASGRKTLRYVAIIWGIKS